MTTYIVLKNTGGGNVDDLWEWVRSLDARSAHSAITQIVSASGSGEGEYVAVPARSWKPVTVKVETKTALKFS